MIRVMIVEDDPMVLEVNEGFLARVTGFELAVSVTTGAQALKQLDIAQPHLVLLDMYLPDISGLEVIRHIRHHQKPCDVIALTAASDSETVQEVLRLGATDYLVKPFRYQRFEAALEEYRKRWKAFQHTDRLKQEDIDQWKQLRSRQSEGDHALPKGLSETTLKQILDTLLETTAPITADQLAMSTGMARVTVRRYLDYLAKEGKVEVHVQYGTVGRPSHYYAIS
ncbi:response regulator [Caldalkalibacillus salinus]|uniref:response regulator n=1 Tax=Caldalkalibacillus salinus TaxID=2803787 RepID=UPI001923B2E8|nr:response regulator [Caldalkalibacillus salinus]